MAKKFNEYTEEDIDLLIQSGAISPETAQQWKGSIISSQMPQDEISQDLPVEEVAVEEKVYPTVKMFGRTGTPNPYNNHLKPENQGVTVKPTPSPIPTPTPTPTPTPAPVGDWEGSTGVIKSQPQEKTEVQVQEVVQTPEAVKPSSTKQTSSGGGGGGYLNRLNAEGDKLLAIQKQVSENFQNRIAKMEQASAEMAEKPFTDFWENKSTGQRLTAALGIIASGIANGMAGKPLAENGALTILNQTIAQDLEKQKAEYNKKQNSFKQSLDLTKSGLDAEMAYIDAAFKNLDKKAQNFVKGEELNKMRETLEIEKMKLLNKGVEATKAQTKADELNMTTLTEYTPNREVLASEVLRLKGAINSLKTDSGISGPIIGKLKIESLSPVQKTVSDAMGSVLSKNLKSILGGQFAASEGERLLKYGFDPNLSQAENLKRAESLLTDIQSRMNYLDGMQNHFNNTGRTYDYRPVPTKEQKLRNNER